MACAKALRQKGERGWSKVWEGEAGARPHKGIIGLMRSIDFILRPLEVMEGFQTEQ